MLANQELMLLIKSRYPLIVVESADEPYVVTQLKQIADGLRFTFYEWSVTAGLEQGGKGPAFHQTFDPEKMLRTVLSFFNGGQAELVPLGSQQPPARQEATRARSRQVESGLFVLKDFDKHLENPVHLRLLKDLIHLFRNTRNTVVMVSPEYKLPKDLEMDAGHIVGGYPDEREIAAIVKDTWNELVRYDKRMKISLAPEEIPQVLRMPYPISMAMA